MIAIDETSSAGRAGPPPITAAERRAERATAAMDLAVRLGRVPRPSTVATARPVPPARKSVPHEPMPVEVLAGLQAPAAAPRDFPVAPMPSEVVDALIAPPSVPGDFVDGLVGADEMPTARPPRITMIIGAVAGYYRISRTELLSARRARAVVRPRQLAMWLAVRLTRASLPEIGRRFGNRDHTTVIHARQATDARLATDPGLKADADALIALLTRAA